MWPFELTELQLVEKCCASINAVWQLLGPPCFLTPIPASHVVAGPSPCTLPSGPLVRVPALCHLPKVHTLALTRSLNRTRGLRLNGEEDTRNGLFRKATCRSKACHGQGLNPQPLDWQPHTLPVDVSSCYWLAPCRSE